jgi:2-C-methyl-D-erythritol 4-phosphate cytidylyltransferase
MAAGVFGVIVVTAAPAGMAAEAGGALVKIDGRESLLRAVELFLNRENVKQIQLVFTNDYLEEGKRKFGGHLSFSGVKVIGAGARWMDQLAAAAEKLAPEATHVIVHDAARPAVPYTDVDQIMTEAAKHAAVALTSPSRSPLVEVDAHGQPMAYRAPTEFVHLATPMAFSRDKFLSMCASKNELHASELTLIKGSPLNVRVGGGGDSGIVKTFLNMLPKKKVQSMGVFEEAQW